MSSNLFMNMLLVERQVVNKSVETLVKQHYNIWFEKGDGIKAFRHENPYDKIIIFYDKYQDVSNKIVSINNNSTWTPNGNPIGYVILFSKGTKVLVSDIKFPGNGLREGLGALRKYLIESIRMTMSTNIDSMKFMIFWRKSIIDPVMKDAHDSGLLSSQSDLSHTFLSGEVSQSSNTHSLFTKPMFGFS